MSKRDPKPEVLRLEELALLVKSGDIKLPRFQRPFVWKRSDMLKLLDSIYKGYPIGSLLLWNSSQRLKSERDIAGLHVDDQNSLYPTNYLLDGQQRLTTLCGALFWEGGPQNSIWNIHFDLENEVFLHPKGSDTVTTLPLNRLINTSDFIRQCMKFEHHESGKVFVERAERLLRSIKDYKVAVVKIGDMSIEEVAPIFERINSTGRKLTMVDLMMAATWSNGFDLSSEIEKIRAACEGAGFFGVTEQTILRSIAASAEFGINKEDIQRLRNLNPEQLQSAAEKCLKAFIAATTWIMERLPIRDASYFPYGLFLTYAVEIFRTAQNLTDEQSSEMTAWFWFTSSTLHFGGASTGQISRDLATARDFASGSRATLFQRTPIDITRLLFDKFSLKNASSTTFSLMLLSKKPSTNPTGRDVSLDFIGEKDGKMFGRIGTPDLEDLNIAVVIDPYRSNAQSSLFIDEPSLEQHLLTTECIKSAKSGDTDSFIASRSAEISHLLEKLTGCPTTYSINDSLISESDTDLTEVSDPE